MCLGQQFEPALLLPNERAAGLPVTAACASGVRKRRLGLTGHLRAGRGSGSWASMCSPHAPLTANAPAGRRRPVQPRTPACLSEQVRRPARDGQPASPAAATLGPRLAGG
ncbi:sperm-associated antigen 1 [Platysternon megacephalum]|uniref:Sperm-associated antigen 1 n=1 Tax=Platysternon megacephalum TaxID=55544 RepID=A0A4D9EFB4_9SAUR|nr:sperm-associated antigen 1 [Platysternon megacephalum]